MVVYVCKQESSGIVIAPDEGECNITFEKVGEFRKNKKHKTYGKC